MKQEFVNISLPVVDWKELIKLLTNQVDHMSLDDLTFFNKLLIHIRDEVANLTFELQTK